MAQQHWLKCYLGLKLLTKISLAEMRLWQMRLFNKSKLKPNTLDISNAKDSKLKNSKVWKSKSFPTRLIFRAYRVFGWKLCKSLPGFDPQPLAKPRGFRAYHPLTSESWWSG